MLFVGPSWGPGLVNFLEYFRFGGVKVALIRLVGMTCISSRLGHFELMLILFLDEKLKIMKIMT